MTANAADLTTLANLKAYVSTAGSNSDALLQSLITSASMAIAQYINRDLVPTTYTDTYDGKGNRVMMLPNFPVINVSAVTINGTVIPAGSVTAAGFYFTPEKLILNGYEFCKGFGNVVVTYTAGFQISSEARTIGTTPYQLTALAPKGTWLSDQGVTFASNGTALTKLASGTPATGQYTVSVAGLYTFAAADTGLGVLLSYGYMPGDLEQACIGTVQYWLNDRQRGGEVSRSMGGQTISYSQKDMPAWVQTALNQRKAVFA